MEKIQELTQRIYQEGVEQAQVQAQKMISDAEKQAQQIVAQAQQRAEELVAEAKRTAAESKERAEKEMRMAAQQALGAIRAELTETFAGRLARQAASDALAQPKFAERFLLEAAKNWTGGAMPVISGQQADELKAYFEANARRLLDSGLKFEQVSGHKALFSISPADGAYRIDFGAEEFERFFREWLRPQMAQILFEK